LGIAKGTRKKEGEKEVWQSAKEAAIFKYIFTGSHAPEVEV